MKRTLTLFVTFVISLTGAFAQSQFYNIAIGVNAGMTTAFTGMNYDKGLEAFKGNKKDLMINKAPSFGVSLDYYFTPFLNAGIEYNINQLKDGPDKHNRQFTSNFSTIELRAGAALGQFVDYTYNDILYLLRGLNMSLGYGVLSGTNSVEDYNPSLGVNPAGYRQHAGDIGKSKFNNVSMFPITIGYNHVIYNQYDEQKILLGVNFKTVFTTSDDIDGFNDDPKIFNNKAKDLYNVFGISIKYMFGPRSLYY
ncbi:hypothetical protein Pedsa_2922 [Pseudopedobacter saltans DSM 12145]|uniref:Outer membrane protein beta-barrel domain-containing protein n=1 Tax=Pseudopedobacter saltans (strain ATCC 51119 / DSM 12145 / JCM 21818 / CCUG 39354 / LMG 10337 / NBRC 100064 / NCIMB 13643) TaxID=762903 RepID=F0S8X4_PSESL|nr:hypothetical protein [Pseudopedobacter saltans]ADY53461.1 hypothetical protein Pedsa_2922 [Pseudopedobacter saltans DSM 12145]